MAIIKPSLNKIVAFDANIGTTINFTWTGAQARKNHIIIREYDTKKVAYDCTETTMALKHTLHINNDSENEYNLKICELKNGTRYEASIAAIYYMYNTENDKYEEFESDFSDVVLFYCLEKPTFEFINFDKKTMDNNGVAKLSFNSIYLNVAYKQNQGEILNEYKFILYDYDGNILLQSEIFYGSASDDILQYSLKGITDTEKNENGVLDYNRFYRIVCQGVTKNGMSIETEQKFVVQKDEGGVGSLIRLEKTFDNNIVVSSNFKIVNSQLDGDEIYLYDENNNPYAIDLRNGQKLRYFDSFTMSKPWSITAIVSGCKENTVLISSKNSANDEFSITYNVKKYSKSQKSFFMFESKVGLNKTVIKSSYLPIVNKWYIIYLKYENGYYTFNVYDPEELGYTTQTIEDDLEDKYPNALIKKFVVKSSEVGLGSSSKDLSISIILSDHYNFEIGKRYDVEFIPLNFIQNIYREMSLVESSDLKVTTNIKNGSIDSDGKFFADFYYTDDTDSPTVNIEWTNVSTCTKLQQYIESWTYLVLNNFKICEHNSVYGDLENYTHEELSNYTYGEIQSPGLS